MQLLIKQWRRVRGMTQAQLAQHLSIAPSTLSRYETGRVAIFADTLGQIADALHIPVALLYLEDTMPHSADILMASILPSVDDEDTAARLHEVLQDLLHMRRHTDPDKPLHEQTVYQAALAVSTFARLLWQMVADIAQEAEKEHWLLQRAIEQTPADGGGQHAHL